MALDNSKIAFYSGWDIDQIYGTGDVNNIVIPINTWPTPLTVDLTTHNLNYAPIAKAYFKLHGDNYWREFNDFNEPTYGPSLNLFLGSTTTKLILKAYNYSSINAMTIDVRWYIWSDKLVY